MPPTRYYDQAIVAPAGTPAAAPVSVPVTLETNHLDRIEIDVPDGHDRLTGIQVTLAGTVIVPFSLNGFLVANDHYFTIPFSDDVTAGSLVVRAYNTDIFDHTFYTRWVIANSSLPQADSIVSAQVAGTVAPGAEQLVGGLAVTPDDLAAAAAPAPAVVPLETPPPDTGGAP